MQRELSEFRILRDEDTAELESMALALYREDPPGHRMSRHRIRRTIAEFSRHPDKGTITIIHVGREIIGYAIVVHFWSNEYGGNIACLDELYIKPAWRSRGVGSGFLKQLARTSGLRGIHLETTPKNNRARRFYCRQGFRRSNNIHLIKEVHRSTNI